MDECGVCNGPGAIYECGCTDLPLGACNCDGDVVTDTSFVAEQVCDEFLWNDILYTTSGTYDWTGVGFEGCDSTAVLELTIWNSSNVEVDSASCVGMTFDGVTIDASGTYLQTLQTSHGCDSITVLNFTLLDSPQPSIQGETTTCIGGSMLLESLDVSGTFDGTPEWLLNGAPAGVGQTYAVPTGSGGDLEVGVVMTNADGCTDTAEVTVTVGPEVMPEITTVDAFDPTCHGFNDGVIQWNTNDPGGQFTFTWEPAVSTSSLGSELSAGFYAVQISSTPNCIITSDVLLGQPDPISFGEADVTEPFCGESNGTLVV